MRFIKALSLHLVILGGLASSASITKQQALISSASCGATSNTCALTIAAISAGDATCAVMEAKIVSQTITAVSDGNGSSFAECSPTTCAVSNAGGSSSDIWCTTSNGGGASTSITITRSSTTSAVWRVGFFEFFTSLDHFVFDTSATSVVSSNTSNPTDVALTLGGAGANQFTIQVSITSGATSVTGAPAGFTLATNSNTTAFGMSYIASTTSGATGTWTFSGSSKYAESAVTMYEAAAAATCAQSITLTGVGCR